MKLIGLYRIAKQLVSRDSMVRQRARYLFARKIRGIDINGVDLDELELDPARSKPYSDSGVDLDRFLQSAGISRSDTTLDLGCGKGGAMITMAKYFSRVDGVEISPELAVIAQKNLKRAGVVASQVFCQDAAEFTDFDCYGVVYLFNPFLAPVLSRALTNLRESLKRCPRSILLIYRNPICDEVVTSAGFRRIATVHIGNQPIYTYEGPRPHQQ